MHSSSLNIRPALSSEELREHIQGYIQVAQSFSPDPLPEDAADRLLSRLITLPGYRPEQVRNAYRDGVQLGGYRIIKIPAEKEKEYIYMDNLTRLPRKLYHVDRGLKLASIIVAVIIIIAICLLIWIMLSQPLSFLRRLQDVLLLGIAILAILILVIYINDSIEVSPEGIAYYGFGFHIYTPWQNIVGMSRMRHPHAPFLPRPVDALLLKSPALLDISISEGKRHRVAVIEKHWLVFSRKPHTYNLCLPLFVSESLASGNLFRHELGLYIREFAPQIFENLVQ